MADTLTELLIGTTPVVTDETRGFWEGTLAEELRARVCELCGARMLPGGPCCSTCLSQDLRWEPVSGRGNVFSFTVVHHAFHPAFAAAVPYVVVDIELEEGPVITSALTGVDPSHVRIGMPVAVWFDQIAEDPFQIPLRLPKFKPLETT